MRGVMRRPVFVFALLAVLAALFVPWVGMPRAAEAVEPRVWFEPSSGNCDHPWVMVGEAYPPNATVTIAVPGMTESEHVTETVSDGAGGFRVLLPGTYQPDCRWGTLLGVAAVSVVDGERTWRVAEYEVLSPWQISTVTCVDRSLTVRGSGFPPREPVELLLADDHFAAHDFAQLAAVTPDTTGTFETTVTYTCNAEGIILLARRSDGWARLDSLARVTPAATGHGVVPTTDRGVPFAFGVLAVAILGGARLASRRRG